MRSEASMGLKVMGIKHGVKSMGYAIKNVLRQFQGT